MEMRASAIETETRAVFDAPVAYWSLIFLTFIMYVAPMGFLPFLIPLHLAQVAAFFAIAAYLQAILKHGRSISIWGDEVRLVLWVVLFAAMSIVWSRWPGGSYEMLFDTYLKSVIVFFLIANLLTTERRIRGLLWALTLYSAFNAVVGINEWRTGTLTYGRIQGAGYSGLTMNPNDLAFTLDLIIPFTWYLYQTSRTQLHKMVSMGTIVISTACVVITWSRSGAIVLFAMLLWFAWWKWESNRAKAIVWACLIITAVLVLAPSGYIDRLSSTTDFSKDQTGSASARWEGIKVGMRRTLEHPLGIGIGMNGLLNPDEGLGWTAGVHNVYLQMSTELGIVPAILFIILLVKLITRMNKLRLSFAPGNISLLGLMAACTLVGFAVGAIFEPVAYNFYFYILAGIALAIKEISRNHLVHTSPHQEPVLCYSCSGASRMRSGA